MDPADICEDFWEFSTRVTILHGQWKIYSACRQESEKESVGVQLDRNLSAYLAYMEGLSEDLKGFVCTVLPKQQPPSMQTELLQRLCDAALPMPAIGVGVLSLPPVSMSMSSQQQTMLWRDRPAICGCHAATCHASARGRRRTCWPCHASARGRRRTCWPCHASARGRRRTCWPCHASARGRRRASWRFSRACPASCHICCSATTCGFHAVACSAITWSTTCGFHAIRLQRYHYLVLPRLVLPRLSQRSSPRLVLPHRLSQVHHSLHPLPSHVQVQHGCFWGLSKQPVHGDPPNHLRGHVHIHTTVDRPPSRPMVFTHAHVATGRQPSYPSVVSQACFATATFHMVGLLCCRPPEFLCQGGK
ncbi:uncharacterized protein LOC109203500 [Oreochromis niloticus]|uniref:uncharacterized protein LOC109203500 n=1 Tax=Oreochromis niloticus TaxID=8128 RepID=UPI000904CA6F|nr:uncharacterized protein LOC109203500 [Oreochromis niloticus]